MKKLFISGFFVAISLLSFSQVKKVLIVATNTDSVGSNASGSYLMEIAYPFQYFTDKGYEVDILTPKGGKTAIYDNGKVAEDLLKISKSELFIKKTSLSLSPDDIKTKDYQAIFYPGGHGQYFDVVNDERIAAIAAAIYESGAVLGTAGHGVASLINIRLSNCNWLVNGKTITCFPTWAEKKYMNISGYGKLLSFDMQQVLARRGANLIVCVDEETRKNPAMTHIVDSKNKIVTGSFAISAKWVAEQMLKLMNE
jgi:putative intracellular protease/amidase